MVDHPERRLRDLRRSTDRPSHDYSSEIQVSSLVCVISGIEE
jgi:hypothetical protein